MKESWHRLSGDWAGARAVTGDWVPRTGMECERARGEAQLRLQDAIPHQLQRKLEQRISLSQEDWARMQLGGVTPQCVVRAGKCFFQPVVYGRADWIGAPQHDHAKVSVSIARDVLRYERGQQAVRQRDRRSRPKLDE